MYSQEKRLQELLIAVRQCANGSPQWRKAMNRLLIEVPQLPGLIRFSDSEYFDALNQTWEWFSKNIHQFDEQRSPSIEEGLTRWINSYLYWRYKDLITRKHEANNQPNTAQYLDNIAIPGGIDSYIEQIDIEQQRQVACLLELYIETDPKGELKSCHPRQYPNCHCQLLSQKLLLKNPPDKLTDIAREININYQTLNYHWKRKSLPLIQRIVKEIAADRGYQSNF